MTEDPYASGLILWRKLMTDATTAIVADAAHKRLDRIEEKIDKLTDFMVAIARVEEKQLATEEEIRHILKRMEHSETKVDRMDSKVNSNEVKIIIISRVFWAVIIAIVVGAVTMNSTPNPIIPNQLSQSAPNAQDRN